MQGRLKAESEARIEGFKRKRDASMQDALQQFLIDYYTDDLLLLTGSMTKLEAALGKHGFMKHEIPSEILKVMEALETVRHKTANLER